MPGDPNALCASWAAQAALVTHECVASPNTDFSLFETYDADQDGDLDLWDMAVFQQTYQSLPKQFESIAQVVSVKCCISEGNLTRIGECLSGPDDTRIPSICGSIGTCVLGFDEPVDATGVLCDPAQPHIPDDPRAVCISWLVQEPTVAQECVASPNTDFNLFETFDADQDGDLDLRDMAVFQRTYQSVPKQVQSDARLVFVECCVPAAGMGVGQKRISGADAAEDAAGSQPVCTLGFSGLLEPGDYLYELCRPGTTPKPPEGSTCVSWSAADVPVAFLCEGAGVCEYRCPTGDDGGTDPGGCFADFAGLEGPPEALPPQ